MSLLNLDNNEINLAIKEYIHKHYGNIEVKEIQYVRTISVDIYAEVTIQPREYTNVPAIR